MKQFVLLNVGDEFYLPDEIVAKKIEGQHSVYGGSCPHCYDTADKYINATVGDNQLIHVCRFTYVKEM